MVPCASRHPSRFVSAAALFLLFAGALAWAEPSPLSVCDDVTDPLSLNPHKTFENKSENVILQIFDGLMRFDENGNIEPALAVRWEYTGPTTLRCRLREGVVFHNGEAMDAEAVRWSIERQIQPEMGFPMLMELSSIESVVVVDSMTVDIRTRLTDGLLLNRLAGYVKILPKKYFTDMGEKGFESHPVGTGPYRFLEWKKGEYIHLEANPRYWEQGQPAIREVWFRFMSPESQMEALFDQSLGLATEIPATRTLEVASHRNTKVLKKNTLTTPAFWFAFFDGPLKDLKVRKALNLAVDKKNLIRYAVLGNGNAIATLSMEGEMGHNKALEPYLFDPLQAKKMLAEAGFARGFTLSMLTSEQSSREARIIAEQWKKIGVRTEMTVVGMKDFSSIVPSRKKTFDVIANLAPNPTGHMYFLPGICFYSRSPYSWLRSPEFDRRYEELARTIDPAEHVRLAEQLDAFIHDEALGVFTYQKVRTYAMNKKLSFKPRVTGMLYLKDAYWMP